MKQAEQLWSRWLSEKGIKKGLFDLDGTLADTYTDFLRIMREGMALFGETHQETLRDLNNKAYEIMGVTPERWEYVISQFEQMQGELPKPLASTIRAKFGELYTTPIKLVPGAEGVLNFFKEIGLPMGIVTHSNEGWARRKFEWMGLSNWMTPDDLYIVNERGHKGVNEWREALKHFGIEGKEALILGDSPRSDIMPAISLGARTVYVDSRFSDGWSTQRVNLEGDYYRVTEISEILNIPDELNR